jgi:hypothetical protein
MSGAEREDRPLDPELLAAAEAIADGRPVDWEAPPAGREASGAWASLQSIAAVASAHRTAALEAEPGVLFRWGTLQALERLGEGSFGEVFRCWDSDLQREVALKLRREGSEEGALRFLAEARRLARVRHPNVLVVHGAAEHHGRVGMWTDLVRGETLEGRLSAGGTLGAEEAALMGCELCRALAAVHAAGLVHGDVKASNVMREEGGRIVLMDFGAASERDAAAAGARAGTPLGMAPEVLAGASPTPQSDVWSLGALLYRLVSGRHPAAAADLDQLLALHAAGDATPLRDLCPDLPEPFVAAVERALAADAAARFASAGAFERALRRVVAGAPEDATRDRRRVVLAALAGVALISVALLLWSPPAPDAKRRGEGARPGATPPAGTLALPGRTADDASGAAPQPTATPTPRGQAPLPRVEVTLFRAAGGGQHEALRSGATLRVGDRLHLEVRAAHPVHLYVVDADARGDLFTLFPLSGSELRNPLPAGLARLPGSGAGTALDWQVTSEGGRETILVAASRRPLAELEARLAVLAEATAAGAQLADGGGAPDTTVRGIGGLVASEPPPGALAGILATLDRAPAVAVWRFELRSEPPGN